MRYDIAIIGTGPAGVSAAITAKIRNKNIILFGSKALSDKMIKAHRILNYPGLPDITGEELAEHMREHLKSLDIEVTEKQVSMVYAMGSYFGIQAGGEMFEASSCILAGGVSMDTTIPGEDNYLGRGVSYCATCDGQFYKDKSAIVVGYNEESIADAEFLSELCSKVYFIPSGKLYGKVEMLKGLFAESNENANIVLINEKPLEISGGFKADTLKTDCREHKADGIFVIRDAVAPDKLIPGLKTDGRHAVVDIQMKTNIEGLFVCGDTAGEPYQYIKAAGQGNTAAISAVRYIDSMQH